MRFVLLALSRPLTIVIALIAVALASLVAVRRMPVDIFPQVGDPAIYVAQPYGGMDPAQMEGFLTYYYEYHFLYITGIDHVESKSIQGAALMKLVFHQGTDMSSGNGRDHRIRQPGASVHATGDGSAVRHTIRRRQRRGRPIGFQQPELHRRANCRIWRSIECGHCLQHLRAFRRRRPLAATSELSLSRSNPDKLRQYRISPEEAIAAVSKRNSRDAFRQHVDRRDQSNRANECDAGRQS